MLVWRIKFVQVHYTFQMFHVWLVHSFAIGRGISLSRLYKKLVSLQEMSSTFSWCVWEADSRDCTQQIRLQTSDIISMSESDTGVHFTDETPACSSVQIVSSQLEVNGECTGKHKYLVWFDVKWLWYGKLLIDTHLKCFDSLVRKQKHTFSSFYKILHIIYSTWPYFSYSQPAHHVGGRRGCGTAKWLYIIVMFFLVIFKDSYFYI